MNQRGPSDSIWLNEILLERKYSFSRTLTEGRGNEGIYDFISTSDLLLYRNYAGRRNYRLGGR
jgi:hypothetical protein